MIDNRQNYIKYETPDAKINPPEYYEQNILCEYCGHDSHMYESGMFLCETCYDRQTNEE